MLNQKKNNGDTVSSVFLNNTSEAQFIVVIYCESSRLGEAEKYLEQLNFVFEITLFVMIAQHINNRISTNEIVNLRSRKDNI